MPIWLCLLPAETNANSVHLNWSRNLTNTMISSKKWLDRGGDTDYGWKTVTTKYNYYAERTMIKSSA